MAGKRTRTKATEAPAAVPAGPDPRLKPRPKPPTIKPLLRITLRALLAMGLIVAVLVAVIRLGGMAGNKVAQAERYQILFSEIQCDPPPGVDRLTFLTEVRFAAEMPEMISVVDPDLPEQLKTAFMKHPWVSEPPTVTINPEGTVRVDSLFRTAILAVKVEGEVDARAVDRFGVLLPSTAPVHELTQLLNFVAKPNIKPGEIWPDDRVKRAADLAQTYKPKTIEKNDKGWRLVQQNNQVFIVSW